MADLKEKLKNIIDEREKRKFIARGEIFIFWGTLNFITALLYEFVIKSSWIWLGMVIIGTIIMIIYFEYVKRKHGKVVFGGKILMELWIFMMILLPFIFWIFPTYLHLYSTDVIWVLIMIILGIAVYISGIITTTISLRVGGIIMFIAAALTGIKDIHWLIPYSTMVLGGLVLPGIFTIIEGKRQK